MQARHRPHWMLWIIPLRSTAWIFGESPSAGVLVIPWLSHGSPMVLPWFSHGSPHVFQTDRHSPRSAPRSSARRCSLRRPSSEGHSFNWISQVQSVDFFGGREIIEINGFHIYIYIFFFSHIFSSMLMYVIYHPRTELGVKSLKTCDLNLCTTYQWAAL